jgi:hypothetical protein
VCTPASCVTCKPAFYYDPTVARKNKTFLNELKFSRENWRARRTMNNLRHSIFEKATKLKPNFWKNANGFDALIDHLEVVDEGMEAVESIYRS